MTWRGLLAAVFIIVGVVLSPLRAVAAVPMLMATVQTVGPTATTHLGRSDAVRREAEHPRINAYDAALFDYDDASNPQVTAGAGAVRAYDGHLEHGERREVRGEGAYVAPSNVTAAEGVASEVQGGATLWRMGTTGVSEAGEAQFWALEKVAEDIADGIRRHLAQRRRGLD
jgi:hypothetical protein